MTDKNPSNPARVVVSEGLERAVDICEGLEYGREGGWLPVVSNLIRFLSLAGCYEHLHFLNREVQSLPAAPMPHVETAALNSILGSLALLYNNPPKNLTQDQHSQLCCLRRQAARFVRYPHQTTGR